MHLIASAVVAVKCPCARAFHFAADLENFGAWFPAVVNVVAADDLPFATVGKTYRETVAVPVQGQRAVTLRVVDASPPRRVVTEGDLPILLPRMEIEFRELAEDACEVRWRMFSRNNNVLARYTLLPVAGHTMRKRAKAGLRTLKQMLEENENPSGPHRGQSPFQYGHNLFRRRFGGRRILPGHQSSVGDDMRSEGQ